MMTTDEEKNLKASIDVEEKRKKHDNSGYEIEYLARKKRLRKLHSKLKDTKEVQEIYHRIMGSNQDEILEGNNKRN